MSPAIEGNEIKYENKRNKKEKNLLAGGRSESQRSLNNILCQ